MPCFKSVPSPFRVVLSRRYRQTLRYSTIKKLGVFFLMHCKHKSPKEYSWFLREILCCLDWTVRLTGRPTVRSDSILQCYETSCEWLSLGGTTARYYFLLGRAFVSSGDTRSCSLLNERCQYRGSCVERKPTAIRSPARDHSDMNVRERR